MKAELKKTTKFDFICRSSNPYDFEVPDKGIKITVRFENKWLSFPGIDISRSADNDYLTVCVTNCKRSLAYMEYLFKNSHGMFLLNVAVQKVDNDAYIVKYDVWEVIKEK